MGRRVRHFLIIPAAAIVLLTLLLATCSNAFNIFEAIKTDLKIANDLFLIIEDVSPANNAVEVSQTKRIEIEFDRAIDENTISMSTIEFSPALSNWDHDYIGATKTLYIYPDPYFVELTPYTVTVTKGLKGTDGSDLQEIFAWAFETKESPRGDFFIEAVDDFPVFDSPADNSATKDDLYTASTQVKLYIEDLNTKAIFFKYGFTEADVAIPGGWLGNPIPSSVSNVDLPDSGTDGEKIIFMGFAEQLIELPSVSELKMDTIILDTTGPSVTAFSKTINKYATFPTTVSGTVTDAYSGVNVNSHDWNQTAGPGIVTFGDDKIEDATINAISDDGSYTLTLTSEDRLGNQNSDSMTLTVDRIPPVAPSVSIETVPDPVSSATGEIRTVDPTPTWTWTQGFGSDGAEIYRYGFIAGKWIEETKATSYTPKEPLKVDNSYTVYVQERDAAGNWPDDSDNGSYEIKVVAIIPEYKEVDVPEKMIFQWASAGKVEAYELFVRDSLGKYPSKGIILKDNYYKGTVTSGKVYYWYYVVYPALGRPYEVGEFIFRTQ